MSTKTHWENVYQTKPAQRVSWYQIHASLSLAMIRRTGFSSDANLIDVAQQRLGDVVVRAGP